MLSCKTFCFHFRNSNETARMGSWNFYDSLSIEPLILRFCCSNLGFVTSYKPWMSSEMWISKRFHAKIYLFQHICCYRFSFNTFWWEFYDFWNIDPLILWFCCSNFAFFLPDEVKIPLKTCSNDSFYVRTNLSRHTCGIWVV